MFDQKLLYRYILHLFSSQFFVRSTGCVLRGSAYRLYVPRSFSATSAEMPSSRNKSGNPPLNHNFNISFLNSSITNNNQLNFKRWVLLQLKKQCKCLDWHRKQRIMHPPARQPTASPRTSSTSIIKDLNTWTNSTSTWKYIPPKVCH
jgi:hypothetical protein